MRSPFPFAGAAVALALSLAFPAVGQDVPDDRKALEEKLRALETKQEETHEGPRGAEGVARGPSPGSPDARAPSKRPASSPSTSDPPGSTGQVSSGTSFNPAISVIPEGLYYNDDRSGGAVGLFEAADGFAGTPVGEGRRPLPRLQPRRDGADVLRGRRPLLRRHRDRRLRHRRRRDRRGLRADPEPSGGPGRQARQVLQRRRLRQQAAPAPVGLRRPEPPVRDPPGRRPERRRRPGHVAPEDARLPPARRRGVPGRQRGRRECSSGPDASPAFADKAGPRLFTGFAKVSPDIGYSDALQIGLFGGRSSLHQEADGAGGARRDRLVRGNRLGLQARLPGAVREERPRLPGRVPLSRQEPRPGRRGGPRPRRQALDGEAGRLLRPGDVGLRAPIHGQRAGTTPSACSSTGSTSATSAALATRPRRRISAALTFNPTEFSRLRAQFNRGDAVIGGVRESFNQFFLQFQLSLGVHGAHKF